MLRESENIELKESFAEWKDIIISLGSFANKKGGKVIVGYSDSGEFVNMKIGKNTIEDFVNKVKLNTDPVLYPSINVKEFALGEYVEIEIPESDNKPVFTFDKAYIRIGKSNIKISNTYLKEIIKRYQNTDFDLQTSDQNFSEDKIDKKWFLTLNNKYFKIDLNDIKEIMTNLGLIQDEKFSNAGFLCFAEDISSCLNATIKLARFKGNSTDVFIDMKNTNGNLIMSVDEALSFMLRSINMQVEIGKQAERIEKWEYPVEALREGLINAIVHRDYTDPGNIQIRIFENRIEIWSPGLLPREINLSKIESECRSIPRNKKIAEIFYKAGLIENWGTGFSRMINKSRLNGNPLPVFTEKAGAM
jgi:ATP-dependent DNA helicase RecG